MWVAYRDILDRIPEPPLWWLDGVPRYEPFKPYSTSVYAGEALLVQAKCQVCSKPFTLGLYSWSNRPEFRKELEETGGLMGIGDPPSHDCTGPGNSMNSVPMRILEFWERVAPAREWERVTSLEGELPDD